MSVHLSSYAFAEEISVFSTKQITMKRRLSSVSKRDLIVLEWIDDKGKKCKCEIYLDGKASKGSIQATKELRKLIATLS